MQGSEEPRDQRNLSRPSPTGKQLFQNFSALQVLQLEMHFRTYFLSYPTSALLLRTSGWKQGLPYWMRLATVLSLFQVMGEMTLQGFQPSTAFIHSWTMIHAKLIHVEVVDKREKEVELKSPRMEKIGLQRALAAVRSKANVTELVIDASRSIDQ